MTLSIKIQRDEYPESPRDWDNLGKMVCFHRRYNLGDEQPSCTPEEFLEGLAYDANPKLMGRIEDALERVNYGGQYPQWMYDTLLRYKEQAVPRILAEGYTILPLFLYDHSGITMNTSGFHCPWDSGQVGFIYCSLKDAAENWSVPEDWDAPVPWSDPALLEGDEYRHAREISAKPRTITLREATRRVLKGEVQTYDQYLQGDVWGYIIEDEDGEVIESCWGFYGEDYCRQEAESVLAYLQKQAA